MLQGVAVCCSVLLASPDTRGLSGSPPHCGLCVAGCYSVLQCVAGCCSVLFASANTRGLSGSPFHYSLCVAVCLQCVAGRCSMFQYVVTSTNRKGGVGLPTHRGLCVAACGSVLILLLKYTALLRKCKALFEATFCVRWCTQIRM